MGGSKNVYYVHKNDLLSIYKIALKLLQFVFYDDFRSKNRLHASADKVYKLPLCDKFVKCLSNFLGKSVIQ